VSIVAWSVFIRWSAGWAYGLDPGVPLDACKADVGSLIVKLPAASFPTDSLVLGPIRHPPSLSIEDQWQLSERLSQ